MFERENFVGLLLLGLCGVVAAVLLYSIATGERVRLDIDPAVGTALAITFIGLILFGWIRTRSGRGVSGGGPQWPDPQTGRKRKSLWDRLRGR
jgi:hypothetical protein